MKQIDLNFLLDFWAFEIVGKLTIAEESSGKLNANKKAPPRSSTRKHIICNFF
jgi:hypothetical protein